MQLSGRFFGPVCLIACCIGLLRNPLDVVARMQNYDLPWKGFAAATVAPAAPRYRVLFRACAACKICYDRWVTGWRLAYFLLILATAHQLRAAEPPAEAEKTWSVGSNTKGVTIYSRTRSGSSLKEFKATGDIEAPTTAVHQVLDDVDSYPAFMPYVAECRIVKREGNSTFTYQRVSPKICSDRDYTLRIDAKSWASEGGLAYLNRWQSANELSPAPKKGVLRVTLCEGSWLLEPQRPGKTRATYSVFTDSGGALPAFIANGASEIGIRKLFAAVRKQVQNPKYSR